MSGTRRRAGRLGPQVQGYRTWLEQRGYTPQTIRNMLKDLGQVGLWLASQDLDAAQLTQDRVAAFGVSRREIGRRRVTGARGMQPLLSYLQEMGVIPGPQPSCTPLDVLIGQYRGWMLQERNLAPCDGASVREHRTTFPAGAGLRRGELRTGCVDRGRCEHIPAPGMRAGVGRLGQGPGRGAPF